MKTRIVIGVSLIVVVVAMANLLPSQAQKATSEPAQQLAGNGAPPLSNPLKVALLKWYKADRTAHFPVGQQPYGVCFDGTNIWTANFGDGTVTKLRANDGALLGTFPAGIEPYGVTFDGANIWVSNVGSNNVMKLRANDGKILGTFPTGTAPTWMTFDGENIWVPNGNNTLTKLRASDGKVLGNFTVGVGPI